MKHLPLLKEAQKHAPAGEYRNTELIRYRSFRNTYGQSPLTACALAQKAWFENFPVYVYECDRIAGSRRGNYVENADPLELKRAGAICGSYGYLGFWTNSDHFAPGYDRFLKEGIRGTMARIDSSLLVHREEPEKVEFLTAMKTVLTGFSAFVRRHADAAREAASRTDDPACEAELLSLADDLDFAAWEAPVTFRQALNLVWLVHLSFLFQNKYAMAFGRIDQYLLPHYEHDIEAGILTPEDAEDLIACCFIKIVEYGNSDVVNICIGGVTPAGEEGINDLSYRVLHAVRDCNVPGPNLSARLHEGMPDRFLDECLQVIGTGLGYPALMNDRVNIPALKRHGYSLEDARDYCFVGCIENFIPGKQPAWSDGRFNVPQFLEAVFYRGTSALDPDYLGLDTGALEDMETMEDFLGAFEKQIAFAAGEYVTIFNNENGRYNYRHYAQPFMSLFCDDCIARGEDINCGGARYPSVHGACGMGIATVADSLAAVEKVVYLDRACTLTELRDAMAADFKGYEPLRARLQNVVKYGNNDDFVDKYAVWYVEFLDRVFAQYHTRDGGDFYTAIASNTQSVSAGHITGATPDGRHAGVPLSDAASPTYGMDKNGPTSAFLSLCKPDYRLVSCGTVVNQKYTPDMLTDPVKRAALRAAIQVYFSQGGQEVQINCVSRETLKDAMAHPENYADLVVRVSGFSAYFTGLGRDVQEDILHRTEHADIH
jgi:formate C-acetyltransferase